MKDQPQVIFDHKLDWHVFAARIGVEYRLIKAGSVGPVPPTVASALLRMKTQLEQAYAAVRPDAAVSSPAGAVSLAPGPVSPSSLSPELEQIQRQMRTQRGRGGSSPLRGTEGD